MRHKSEFFEKAVLKNLQSSHENTHMKNLLLKKMEKPPALLKIALAQVCCFEVWVDNF